MKIQFITTILIGLFAFGTESKASSLSCNANQSSYNCLVCNCYHESRGENFEGMVAVAKVVVSRSESDLYPNSVCQVIYQPYQFSWTKDKISNSINAAKADEEESFNNCKRATDVALREGGNGVLYYYNPDKARPAWARAYTPCGSLGNHTFLTPRGTKCPRTLGSTGRSSGSDSGSNSKSKSSEGRR